MSLGFMTFFQGDFDRTRMLVEESAALGRTEEDLAIVASSLGIGALSALERGEVSECARLAVESQAAARACATPWIEGMAVSCLGYLAMHEGDLERACVLQEEALDWSRKQGDKWAMGITLFDLALLRALQQRHDEASALCAEGIGLYREFGDRRGIAWCLGILSGTEAAEGRALRAARLRGAMEGLLESVGAPIQESFKHWMGERSLDTMRAALGDSAFHTALAEGRSMPLSRAIQFGLERD